MDMGKQVSSHNHFICANVLAVSQDRIHLGALKYIPHAVMKLLENIPYPWEQVHIPHHWHYHFCEQDSLCH